MRAAPELEDEASTTLDEIHELLKEVRHKAVSLSFRVRSGPAAPRLGEGRGSSGGPEFAVIELVSIRDSLRAIVTGRH